MIRDQGQTAANPTPECTQGLLPLGDVPPHHESLVVHDRRGHAAEGAQKVRRLAVLDKGLGELSDEVKPTRQHESRQLAHQGGFLPGWVPQWHQIQLL